MLPKYFSLLKQVYKSVSMYEGKYSNNQVCKMTAKLGYNLLHLHVKPYTYFLSYAQEMFLHENRIPLTTYQGIMYTNNNKLYITPTLLRVLCILIILEPQKLKTNSKLGTMTLSLTQGITKKFSQGITKNIKPKSIS